jgi:PIN domain nuclease of toxin-antitoxin system
MSNPEKLSQFALKAIAREKETETIIVSAISVWEIYLLVKKERLKLSMDIDSWFEKVSSLPYIQFVPIDTNIAAKSVMLPAEFHADPADRMIVATARERGISLVTADDRIRKYNHVQTIW